MRALITVCMLLLALFGILFLGAWLQLGRQGLFGLPVPADVENVGIMVLSGVIIARLAYALHTLEHPRQRRQAH